MAKNYRNNRRRENVKAVGCYYKKKLKWLKNCIYCGCIPECFDHAFPISVAANLKLEYKTVRRELKQGLNMVPCCNKCNNIAGDKVFTLIKDKRKYIQEKLKKKYLKYARHVIWEKDEIDDLGPNMKAEVLRAMKNRYEIEMMITWPNSYTLSSYGRS